MVLTAAAPSVGAVNEAQLAASPPMSANLILTNAQKWREQHNRRKCCWHGESENTRSLVEGFCKYSTKYFRGSLIAFRAQGLLDDLPVITSLDCAHNAIHSYGKCTRHQPQTGQ